MSAACLSLEDVSVGYFGRPAISGISFEVYSGEIFGLIGLNGAGKTTMIKSILGLRDQDGGEILIRGQRRTGRVDNGALAYLPEKFEPPWFLKGMEFLKFSLALYKVPFDKDDILRAADNIALDRAALDRRVHTYSKGMRQKLGLMGTLLTGCNLFILDEPMSGLDPLARSRVKSMILDCKKNDRTIFLSSHILADMDEICDRIALLHKGAICFLGTPEELKKQTKKEYLEQAFLEFIEK